MASTVRAVGDPIESKCTKCKTVTKHIIVSLVEGEAAKVQCKVCEGFHNYRPPAANRTNRDQRLSGQLNSPRRTTTVSALEAEWEAKVGGRDRREALPYHVTARFRVGDLIDHPTFGLGLVRKAIPPNKIEVHFREGFKRMLCAP